MIWEAKCYAQGRAREGTQWPENHRSAKEIQIFVLEVAPVGGGDFPGRSPAAVPWGFELAAEVRWRF